MNKPSYLVDKLDSVTNNDIGVVFHKKDTIAKIIQFLHLSDKTDREILGIRNDFSLLMASLIKVTQDNNKEEAIKLAQYMSAVLDSIDLYRDGYHPKYLYNTKFLKIYKELPGDISGYFYLDGISVSGDALKFTFQGNVLALVESLEAAGTKFKLYMYYEYPSRSKTFIYEYKGVD